MKILITSPMTHPENHPLCNFVDSLVQELQKAHEVKVISFGKKIAGVYKNHQTIISKKQLFPIRVLSFLWEIFKNQKETQLIFCQHALVAALPSLIASKILRIPLFINFSSDEIYERFLYSERSNLNLSEFYKTNMKTSYQKMLILIQKSILKMSTKIIVPNNYMKTHLVVNFKINPNKIFTVYPFYNWKVSLPFATAKEKYTFMTFVSIHKNALQRIEDLIHQISGLRKVYPLTHFHIFGDGSGKDELEKKITENGQSDFITLHGRVSHPEIFHYKKIASYYIFLNPSTRNISHLPENFATNTISILKENSLSDELIENYQNGITYNSLNFLENVKIILNNADLRENIIANGNKELATKFSIKSYINSLLKIYES